jgi:hypothetical protein
VWGAQGGKARLNGVLMSGYAGGGYSVGNISLSINNYLYIAVGGKGTDGQVGKNASGGWNGGGASSWDYSDDEVAGSGGGCTSITSTKRSDGQLKNYSSVKTTEVLIVAGGGGGVSWADYNIHSGPYGYGGGISGGATHNTSKVANQSSGYSFGLGQSYSDTGKNYTGQTIGIPGGGGGYYGGYCDLSEGQKKANSSCAGGGSGYIGGVTNGSTIAGNQTIPSPTGGTETGHTGNGYCKITWHPAL